MTVTQSADEIEARCVDDRTWAGHEDSAFDRADRFCELAVMEDIIDPPREVTGMGVVAQYRAGALGEFVFELTEIP